MSWYYVKPPLQSSQPYEIHHRECRFLPVADTRTLLGWFTNQHLALAEALEVYGRAKLCSQCCKVNIADPVNVSGQF